MAEYTASRERKISGFNARNLKRENSYKDSKYESFQIGKFRGTLRRRLMVETQKAGQIDLRHEGGELQITTFFSVAIPSVQSFHFTVALPKVRWESEARSEQAFLESLFWEMPERELDEAFRRPKSIQLLRALFSLGPGSITCVDNDFSIYIRRGIKPDAELEFFFSTAKKLFRVYAQVVQLNVLAWRSPENNYDWWNKRDRTFV